MLLRIVVYVIPFISLVVVALKQIYSLNSWVVVFMLTTLISIQALCAYKITQK